MLRQAQLHDDILGAKKKAEALQKITDVISAELGTEQVRFLLSPLPSHFLCEERLLV